VYVETQFTTIRGEIAAVEPNLFFQQQQKTATNTPLFELAQQGDEALLLRPR